MKIVIVMDSFKGSLSSRAAGEAAAKGVLEVIPSAEVVVIPVADGGEGTVETLSEALGCEIITSSVAGPLGNPVEAAYAKCSDLAIIEIAAACGITLIDPAKRNLLKANSYGVGQLIKDAIKRGCRRFLIGLGGSATNDAGIGMLQALGWQFYDETNNSIGVNVSDISRIRKIDSSEVLPELRDCEFTLACDVTNPLTGPNGASRIFGPQKGATSEMIEQLDLALSSFSQVVASEIGMDYSMSPGAGAAGGLGFAFIAFLNSCYQPGIETVLDILKFDQIIKNAELVITGEGRLDLQTLSGKTPVGVLRHCQSKRIPVIAIGGSVSNDAVTPLIEAGFAALLPIVSGPVSLEEALSSSVAKFNITRTVSQMIRLLKLRTFL